MDADGEGLICLLSVGWRDDGDDFDTFYHEFKMFKVANSIFKQS